jgi:hypothetical protein
MCLLKLNRKCKGSRFFDRTCGRLREIVCRERKRLEASIVRRISVIEQGYKCPTIGI